MSKYPGGACATMQRLEEQIERNRKTINIAYEKDIKQLARIAELEEALAPFTQPALRLRLGGNSPREGATAIVFQRNDAKLRLQDFDLANEVLNGDTT